MIPNLHRPLKHFRNHLEAEFLSIRIQKHFWNFEGLETFEFLKMFLSFLICCLSWFLKRFKGLCHVDLKSFSRSSFHIFKPLTEKQKRLSLSLPQLEINTLYYNEKNFLQPFCLSCSRRKRDLKNNDVACDDTDSNLRQTSIINIHELKIMKKMVQATFSLFFPSLYP